ncbi:MAG TPA: tripartite tricarboxylate transporter substrate binding protein [Pseudolabrys sp.]|nr:tripartite tricarboxylate transporter substrate binding protein [Pseudolabrys sp.]
MNYTIKVAAAIAIAFSINVSDGKSADTTANYPTRVITLIAASAAGGPADIAARTIAERMSETLGQHVIVENVPGGGGIIGAARVAQAAPDGYTLLIHQTGIAISASLHRKITFDIKKDLAVVGLVNTSNSFLIGKKSLAAANWNELLAYMKKQPTSFAHPGVGALGHMAGVLIAQSTGVKLDFVSYRGLGPAMNDILGGHVDLLWAGAVSAVPAIKAGKVHVYAYGGEERSPLLPDVPTLKELGYPNVIVPFWHALFAPAGTPAPIIEKLNTSLRKALADPRVVKAFTQGGVEIFPPNMLSAAAGQAFFNSEIDRWKTIVNENDIAIEQ